MNASGLKGWTDGADAILHQSCGKCNHVFYFHRAFCPSCGAADLQVHSASGKGVVYAATIVLRAATPETREFAPYAILLIDMDEGFRIMAHGDSALAIGDIVTAEFRPFANGVRAPYFTRA